MLIQKWELLKYSHQDVTLQVHKNSKVMEDNQLFQDIWSTPRLKRRQADTFYQVKAATAAV